MNFNEKIILLRKQKGFTQEDLAVKLNVSRQSVSKWEVGECYPDTIKLKELAQLFAVSIDYLLFDDYEEKLKEAKEKHNVNNHYNIINNKWWVFILIGFIGIVICIIWSFRYTHYFCHTGHSGILGYLEDWCFNAIFWKICLLISGIFFIFGIIKNYNLK